MVAPFRFGTSPLRVVTVSLALVHLLGAQAQTNCLSSKRGRSGALAKHRDIELAPMDLLHQRITLDLTLGNLIAGRCDIRAVPRNSGVSNIELDLTALTVDSVVGWTGTLAFTRTGEVLDITFPAALDVTDTVDLSIHYRGDPVTDPSGFGGFYTGSSLIYNLGVAFESIPHSYGRVWFPCLDNFTERNTYEFLIKTAGGKKAWCNGSLVERTQLGGDTVVSHWRINETIPSYLASVAASNFVVARDTFPSTAGTLTPVELIAAPGDTTGMKNSFVHLQDAFDLYEADFGPHRWEKVGYVLTPIGAMEHATSVHYPRSIATGSLQYEATMAHELAHSWFGNLVTCERAEEMYINEGFAEYLSYLFLEQVYGQDRYMRQVRTNHRDMVHRAHLLDEGWWTLSDMPQSFTYGEHTYNKGADVLHTLRNYMGAEAFTQGLTSFLTIHAFQPVNTPMLRDHLSQSSGMDLTDFFANWIDQPGWAAFEIDAQSFTPGEDGWIVNLTIGQKLRGPASLYNNVPVTIAVVGTDVSNVFRDTVLMGGESTNVTLTVPFGPAWVWLNDDDRISLAFTGQTDTISAGGIIASPLTNFELRPVFGDTIVVRTEQYWVAPDPGTFDESFAYTISPDRYWRVTGNWTDALRFTARVEFDARNTASSNYDVGLFQNAIGPSFQEDSLVLLHRSGPDASWVKWADEVVNFGSATNGYCRLDVDSLLPGEYAFALRTSTTGMTDRNARATIWSIQPNPANDQTLVVADRDLVRGSIEVTDAVGKKVLEATMYGSHTALSVADLANGVYTACHLAPDGKRTLIGPLVVEH